MASEQASESIELDDFVRSTLLHIIEGVHQARVQASAKYASDGTIGIVAPPIGVLPANKEVRVAYAGGLTPIEDVEFDVGVTAATSTKGEGGVAIKILRLGRSAEASHVAEQRIRFKVPLAFPLPSPPRS